MRIVFLDFVFIFASQYCTKHLKFSFMEPFLQNSSVVSNFYTTIFNEDMNCIKVRVWKFVGKNFEKKYVYQNTISSSNKPIPFDDIVRVLELFYPHCNIEFTCMFTSDGCPDDVSIK